MRPLLRLRVVIASLCLFTGGVMFEAGEDVPRVPIFVYGMFVYGFS